MDYTLLLTTAFLLLYVNFLFTSYHIFDIEYGAVVTVDIFRTKVFIIVKQFAKLQIIQDLFLHCFNKKKSPADPLVCTRQSLSWRIEKNVSRKWNRSTKIDNHEWRPQAGALWPVLKIFILIFQLGILILQQHFCFKNSKSCKLLSILKSRESRIQGWIFLFISFQSGRERFWKFWVLGKGFWDKKAS